MNLKRTVKQNKTKELSNFQLSIARRRRGLVNNENNENNENA